MSGRDPLCYLLDHGPGPCDLCVILAEARQQGQREAYARPAQHPVFCWCSAQGCYPEGWKWT